MHLDLTLAPVQSLAGLTGDASEGAEETGRLSSCFGLKSCISSLGCPEITYIGLSGSGGPGLVVQGRGPVIKWKISTTVTIWTQTGRRQGPTLYPKLLFPEKKLRLLMRVWLNVHAHT